MTYSVAFAGPAARYLRRLDVPTQRRMASAIQRLAEDPFGPSTKPLQGREERSIRVRGWRLLYIVDTERQLVTVLTIGPRGEVYRSR